MEDEGKGRATSQFSQIAKYFVAFLLGAMLYDWADDQFDEDEEKPQWQFVEVDNILLLGNTRTGVLYERETHISDETYYRWNPVVSAPKKKK